MKDTSSGNVADATKLLSYKNGSAAIVCKDMNAKALSDKAAMVVAQQQTLQKPLKPLGEQHKAVLRQKLMVLLGNSGVIGAGMVISMPSVTLGQLMDPNEPFTLNNDEASWYSSINNMACPLGGLLVSYLLDRIGRKFTILFTNIVGLLGWLLLATCFMHTERDWIYIQLLIARALGGVMIGLFLSPVGVYSAEISLPRIRGRLILGTSIALATGILLMYIFGYFIRSNIVLISTICGIYQLVSTLLVFPMPESPSWLMHSGREERARKSLKYFRGLSRKESICVEEFETELAQIRFSADSSRNNQEQKSFWQAIKLPEVYKPLLIVIGFFGFQQFSGVVVTIVYASQIALLAGVSIDPALVAVMVGVARIITTFFMSTIFEKWGRKPAGVVSASGMGVCMLMLALSGWCPNMFGTFKWLPVICIVAHIIFSTMGMLTLPFIMISEVFPQTARGIGSGISVFFGMIISFAVIKVYPNMEAALGTANLFAFYAISSFLAVAFICYIVPETRGRTLLEIEESFRSGKKGLQKQNNLKEVELNEIFLKK